LSACGGLLSHALTLPYFYQQGQRGPQGFPGLNGETGAKGEKVYIKLLFFLLLTHLDQMQHACISLSDFIHICMFLPVKTDPLSFVKTTKVSKRNTVSFKISK